MRLRYFVLDAWGNLQKVPQAVVEGISWGKRPIADLKFPAGSALRIVSVVCDDQLRPQKPFLMRVTIDGETVSLDARLEATADVMNFASGHRPKPVTHPSVLRHLEGWPPDFLQQLAIALDFPITDVKELGIGGPLPMAVQLRLSVREVLKYFEGHLGGESEEND